MNEIITIYNNYSEYGIKNRKITTGKESELVYEYIEYRKNHFQANNDKKMAIFIEPQVGSAYPDIVFVEYNPENYTEWNHYRNDLGKNDLKVLYHIYSVKAIDLEGIVSQLGLTWKESGLSVEKLYDSKLIVRKNGKWILKDSNGIKTNNIQAVEAKIDKWHEVLQQSILNKNFASESYALMGLKNKPTKEILSHFSRFGVGLYIKEGDGFATVKKAKTSNSLISFNTVLINEWIGRILFNGDGLNIC